MAKYSMIAGTGSYFPKKILSNKDLEKLVETSDEWITSRTGIKERHIAGDEKTSEMAFNASINALEMAKLPQTDIDGVICASVTQDTILPSLSCMLQDKLSIGGKSFAFDVEAACTGFIYACSIADAMIKTGMANNILVVGVEKLSAYVDWDDRSTCVLFGDGAGAAVISAADKPGFRSFNLSADGKYKDLLTIENLGINYLADLSNRKKEDNYIKMKGNDVFKVAVKAMSDYTVLAIKNSGLASCEIDYFIPHQANLRIIDAAAKRAHIAKEKVIITLDKYGNTSAASIPTALDLFIRNGTIKKGCNIVSSAFGGGLTWGAMVYTI